ncbi:hypothetical protein M942_00245 [Enterobacter ludwigii]|nr:hypothetical protein M942_00245 [Enterobacter ludwigii]KLP39093.1 hypothetical protein ABR36_11310 [Enterobacter ludwigii]
MFHKNKKIGYFSLFVKKTHGAGFVFYGHLIYNVQVGLNIRHNYCVSGETRWRIYALYYLLH